MKTYIFFDFEITVFKSINTGTWAYTLIKNDFCRTFELGHKTLEHARLAAYKTARRISAYPKTLL
jgi:hypothetical protein